jgi:hypothetical protein
VRLLVVSDLARQGELLFPRHRKRLPGLGHIQEHLPFFGRPSPAQQGLALLNVLTVIRDFFHQAIPRLSKEQRVNTEPN